MFKPEDLYFLMKLMDQKLLEAWMSMPPAALPDVLLDRPPPLPAATRPATAAAAGSSSAVTAAGPR